MPRLNSLVLAAKGAEWIRLGRRDFGEGCVIPIGACPTCRGFYRLAIDCARSKLNPAHLKHLVPVRIYPFPTPGCRIHVSIDHDALS